MKRILIWFWGILLVSSLSATQKNPLTVREVYADLNQLIGKTVLVHGFYHSAEYPSLAQSEKVFQQKIQPAPCNLIQLKGMLPEVSYRFIEIEGIIDTVARRYPLWGIRNIAQLTIKKYQVLAQKNPPTSNITPFFSSIFAPQGLKKPNDATFALLVCGADTLPEFWFDMVAFWDFIVDSLHVDLPNIYAYYYNGISRNEERIPSSHLRAATKANIKAGFQEMRTKISHCKKQSKIAKVFRFVTSSGAGYHRGSVNAINGAQLKPLGWCGGLIDADVNDETDYIAEAAFAYNANLFGPAPGEPPYYRPLFEEQPLKSLKIVNDPLDGLALHLYDEQKQFWKEVGRDVNGDGIVNATDGGVDLNLNGEKSDAFAFDEHIALAWQGEIINDDEWVQWENELTDSSLVRIYSLADFCFCGGFKTDEEIRGDPFIASEEAVACEEGELSFFSSEFKGSNWGRFFLHYLDADADWNKTFWLVLQYASFAQTPFYWRKASVHVEHGYEKPIKTFELLQNYPNPFNSRTRIPFNVPETTFVEIWIYNVLGVHLKTLHQGLVPKGRHWTTWDGKDKQHQEVSSGIYFYQLKTAHGVHNARKMFLLK